MHISAFVPATSVEMEANKVNATGIPLYGRRLPPLEADQVHRVAAPILFSAWTENGRDPNPCLYIQVRDPNGERRGGAELIWLWNDVPDHPAKWIVRSLKVPYLVFEAGVYTFSVFNRPDDPQEEALAQYPFRTFFDPAAPFPESEVPPGSTYQK